MIVIAWYRLSPENAWINQGNNPAYVLGALAAFFIYALWRMAAYSSDMFWRYILILVAMFTTLGVVFVGGILTIDKLTKQLGRDFTDSGWFIFAGLLVLILPGVIAALVAYRTKSWFSEK